jgi:hypothetical protein
MGLQREIPPSRRLFVVASTPEEADAQLDLLEKMKNRTGRKYRLDHYAVAFTAAKALPPEPIFKRRQRTTLPRDCIGRKPIRTKGDFELAGFNPDPKVPKYDLRAAQALQHALAWRGERVTLSNAVKIMQRARKLLSRKP